MMIKDITDGYGCCVNDWCCLLLYGKRERNVTNNILLFLFSLLLCNRGNLKKKKCYASYSVSNVVRLESIAQELELLWCANIDLKLIFMKDISDIITCLRSHLYSLNF